MLFDSFFILREGVFMKKNGQFCKYVIIVSILLIGIAFTILFSTKKINNDVLFAMGSGIFGSAFVTLIIEIMVDIRESNRVKRQKKLAFEDIKSMILSILRNESYNFSIACSLFDGDDNKKLKQKEYTIKQILKLIDGYIDEVQTKILKDSTWDKDKVIDNNWLSIEQKKNYYIYSNALPYYESLLKYINPIILNKDFYIDIKVIDELSYKLLSLLSLLLQQIINCSQSKDREIVIEDKKEFFKELVKVFEILDINIEDKLKIRF